jgi:hypothetical protein
VSDTRNKVRAAQLPTVERIKAVQKAARKCRKADAELSALIDSAPADERPVLSRIATEFGVAGGQG